MGQSYTGRHRDADATPAAHPAARHRVPVQVIRRPLLTAGTAVALLGVSAAGYARSGETLPTITHLAATFNVPGVRDPLADVRHSELLARQSYRETAARASTMRTSYAAGQAKAAAAAKVARAKAAAAAEATKAKQAAAAQVAAIAAQRRAEAERVARDAQRVALIANAQNDPRSVARTMLGDHGWSDGQWSCLEQLWVGESGWNYRAENSASGAYGIPQSLPASKMSSAGADYRTNPVTQITWGMNYIKNSYGSPCSALATWNSRSPHWY